MRNYTQLPVHPLNICTRLDQHDHAYTWNQLEHARWATRLGAPSTLTGTWCSERLLRLREYALEWGTSPLLPVAANQDKADKFNDSEFKNANAITATALLRWDDTALNPYHDVLGEKTEPMDTLRPPYEAVTAPIHCIGYNHAFRLNPAPHHVLRSGSSDADVDPGSLANATTTALPPTPSSPSTTHEAPKALAAPAVLPERNVDAGWYVRDDSQHRAEQWVEWEFAVWTRHRRDAA
ncbi:hypothetical protein [Curtobacterium sp. KT1]|uniref:hypothetical protein n=1 Tax=Curtobacterium sp. KT1 TaxID=3372858 RepID=UPI0037BF3D72